MTNYQTLKDKPKRFLALTGYTPEEFSKLSSCFSECFLEYVQTHTLEGKRHKKRRYTEDSGSSSLTSAPQSNIKIRIIFDNNFLFMLTSLKTNMLIFPIGGIRNSLLSLANEKSACFCKTVYQFQLLDPKQNFVRFRLHDIFLTNKSNYATI